MKRQGLVLTSAIVATKNVGRALSRCLFNELISTFFGALHFGRNNDQAQKTDIEQVIKLWEACGLTVAWNDPGKDIDRKLSEHSDLFLVGTMDDQIIACAMGGYDGHRGSINYLAVSSIYQNKGYGKQILNEIESRLLDLGCPKINLMVRTSNKKVIKFYERLNYKIDPVICIGKRLIL